METEIIYIFKTSICLETPCYERASVKAGRQSFPLLIVHWKLNTHSPKWHLQLKVAILRVILWLYKSNSPIFPVFLRAFFSSPNSFNFFSFKQPMWLFWLTIFQIMYQVSAKYRFARQSAKFVNFLSHRPHFGRVLDQSIVRCCLPFKFASFDVLPTNLNKLTDVCFSMHICCKRGILLILSKF